MLRNLIILGAVAGSFASVPMIYERNPEPFERALRGVFGAGPRQGEPSRTASPAARESAQDTEVLLGRKVRVSADARGHYSADFKLNGRTVNALVDTGATTVAINESTARRIGIRLSQSDFRYRVNTANGEAAAAATVIEDVQIGRIVVEKVRAVVLEDEALGTTLVGMSFLNRLSRFQVEGGALLLEQ